MTKIIRPLPAELRLNRAKTASFDVDAQKGFTPLCPKELPVPNGDSITGELNTNAGFAKFRIGSKDAHSRYALWVASSPDQQFQPVPGAGTTHPDVDIQWVLHCEVGTKGFELLDGLPHPRDYSYFVYKGMEPDMHPYGAVFHDHAERLSTGALEFMKVNGIDTVVVGGLATDYCVKLTVLQLLKGGLRVIVNLGACRGISENTTDGSIDEMMQAGALFVNNASELTAHVE